MHLLTDRHPLATRRLRPPSKAAQYLYGAAALQLKAALRGRSYDEQVQLLSPGPEGDAATADIHQKAQGGLAGGGGAMPHREAIQRSFGGYDVSNIIAHTDASAKDAAASMGADAYATGDHIVLGDKGQSLHTVAHEAAHVVQQRAGVSLSGGVGKAGDPYEQHADAVADLVVQGKSAEGLLGSLAGEQSGELAPSGRSEVQRQERRTPGEGTEYSVDRYRQDLMMILNFSCDYHRSAASQVQSTLGRQQFDAEAALGIISSKMFGKVLGAVPGAGDGLELLWDIGSEIYGAVAAAQESARASDFFRDVIDRINSHSQGEIARIVRVHATGYEASLAATEDATTRQRLMDQARRGNVRALESQPSATTIEAGLYEAYLTARAGVTAARIELRYAGPRQGPHRLDSAKVEGSGADSAIAQRLTQLHGGRVDLNELACRKRLYARNSVSASVARRAPSLLWSYIELDENNNVIRTNADVEPNLWRGSLGGRLPTVALR